MVFASNRISNLLHLFALALLIFNSQPVSASYETTHNTVKSTAFRTSTTTITVALPKKVQLPNVTNSTTISSSSMWNSSNTTSTTCETNLTQITSSHNVTSSTKSGSSSITSPASKAGPSTSANLAMKYGNESIVMLFFVSLFSIFMV